MKPDVPSPQDTDPLTPLEMREEEHWTAGYFAGASRGHHEGYRRGLRHHYLAVAVGMILACLVGLYLGTLYGKASAATISADPTNGATGARSNESPAQTDGRVAPARRISSSDRAPIASLEPVTEPPAAFGGTATWYDDGPGLYAAVPTWHFGDARYSVTVCRADDPGRCVVVTVRDFCGCPGDRVIDLSPSSFSRLAPLSQGIVRVVVTEETAGPTPPATDP